ncbi:phospholipase D family protein [Gracilibacillus kekensis]|uniref:PLD-like domain-containing protein n=1 Tax=Gracilibacillus kekensis TaxID=1027249 RepID=A0A1M7L4H0_9BACI|nr:phospholipase D family protein [Gracilibacillus kekensis]SHM72781.1 PLD-like domain-containing protein [Gracilibacillus kekensis]
MKRWYKKKRYWAILLILIYASVIAYQQFKPLPDNISYRGDWHEVGNNEIEFLYDLTYQKDGSEKYDQQIFDEVYQTIEEAEQFLVLDFFMMNESSSSSRNFPEISETLSQKLIKQKEKFPEIKIVFITDRINTTYSSHSAQHIEPLEKAGIEVIYTDLERLRDPNPLYSGIWRMALQWFGQKGEGWLANPFGSELPDVTARSYLELLNIKANHRKVVVSENNGLVLSANPHDASGFHSNIGFKVKGNILKDFIESEKAVASFSGGNLDAFPTQKQLNDINSESQETSEKTTKIQLVTEQQIQQSATESIDTARKDDEIWLGMFYLADRDIVDALKEAADRDVQIHIILDPNQNAFGSQKLGLPNIPVASELVAEDRKNLTVKWYNTNKEQYHSKILFVKRKDSSKIVAGSGNYTSRNIDNYNLETNLYVTALNDAQIIKDVEDYFHRIWNNEDGIYTDDYDKYADSLPFLKRVGYTLQKITMFTTY